MFPSASLLLLLLLGLSQALPLHEKGDQDGDHEHEGVLDDVKDEDGDREHEEKLDDVVWNDDKDEDKDREHEEKLDDVVWNDDKDEDKDREHEEKLDDVVWNDDKDEDKDREHEEKLDDVVWNDDKDEDKDREHERKLDEEKGDHDGDKDRYHDEEKDGDHTGDKEEDKEHVDISTRILRANNGSDELLFEGDMVVPKHRNAIKCYYAQCLWQKGYDGLVRVPYVISSDFSSDDTQTILDAMNAFVGRTCIRFTPRTNEYDYVSIVNKGGCYSSLGKTGGMQELSLNRGGCIYSGIAQHEMNHALGFQHEQVRSDRDSYVTINWANIIPEDAYNFYKADTNNLNTPYDYTSVMHYGRDAFATAYGLYTITPIPNPNVAIGQREGLSYWDITRINLLYNC